jgi:hypothetical protein
LRKVEAAVEGMAELAAEVEEAMAELAAGRRRA